MQLPFIPFDVPVTAIILLVLFFLLLRDLQRRLRKTPSDQPDRKSKQRGPDMDYSAGRDAAHQNTRLQQVFIPMDPDEEQMLRAFYLGELGLVEMRAPNYPQDQDGFWAVSGARRIYFGTRPSFPFDPTALPSFPLANLPDVADRLTAAGYAVTWDTRLSYVQRLIVTDPAGTQIALIGA